MLSKELKLDFEALLSQLINGKGYLHYGVWDGLDPQNACLADVGQAQQQYFDVLVNELPPAPARLLDVGSGTGANAAELVSLGYEVECICPSPRLNALARTKLGNRAIVHETTFEDFESAGEFDAIIFAESFHYIRLSEAVEKIHSLSPQRFVIFDYFHRNKSAAQGDTTRQSMSSVMAALEGDLDGYHEVTCQDMTLSVIPTFDVLSRLNHRHVAPFISQLKEWIRVHRPLTGWLVNGVLDRIYRAPRDAAIESRSHRFSREYEYRLITFAKTQT